jgi:hypothetical protein
MCTGGPGERERRGKRERLLQHLALFACELLLGRVNLNDAKTFSLKTAQVQERISP